MNYTAVIRTLGRAGEKYQRLLDSLCGQTIRPTRILVYIADGYPLPAETCGREEYIYVRKGMVAQRALRYDEVETEYILFVDDDVCFPADGVEKLFGELRRHDADVVAPDVFDNASRGLKSEIMMTLSGRMRARRGDRTWAYKVMATAGYSYNKSPENGAYLSQTNAGPCFLCRKSDFLKIRFEDEVWLDRIGYAIGEDQIMFYKMYLAGLKSLTVFGTGIEHLDAGGNLGNKEKELMLIEGDYFFRKVFWHRFLQLPERNWRKRMWNAVCINYFYLFGFVVSWLKGERDVLRVKRAGLASARSFLKSDQYASLSKVEKKI
ncbi:MAG: glycosyltransferase [Muribaculaceae bacterium]|nr:glycosyltransferase [Muribaculaceae bacterium]